MKKVRLMTTAALVAIAGFTTISLTSCTKDDVVCAVGLEGKNCDQEVREKYYNSYVGSGTAMIDGELETFTDWELSFTERGTDPTGLKLELRTYDDELVVKGNAHLKTNTTFRLEETSMPGGFIYTGDGSVNENSASLTLTEDLSGDKITITFTNMSK